MPNSDLDAWPTPDHSTVEKAAMVIVDERGPATEDERIAALAEVLADPAFKLIVSTIWADRLPTPDAYHRADRAWRERLDRVNRVITVINRWQTWREQLKDGETFADFYDQVLGAISDQVEGDTRPQPSEGAP